MAAVKSKEEGKRSYWVAGHLALIAGLVLLSLYRYFVQNADDKYFCHALLNEGSWLDESPHANWQPNGCMLHQYKSAEVESCFNGRHVVFVGDSTVRQVYYATVKSVDSFVSMFAEKHSDRSIYAKGIRFDFIWDPFLNSTHTESILKHQYLGIDAESDAEPLKPALLVIGSGLWFLRNNAQSEVAVSQWKTAIDRVFAAVKANGNSIADEIILQPVEYAIESRLNSERAATVRNHNIDEMNAILRAREVSPVASIPGMLSIPWAFNRMVENQTEETDDGLHFSDPVTRAQANVLLNFRCNDLQPKKFPVDKTCCASYPTPHNAQFFVLIFLVAISPVAFYFDSRPDFGSVASWLPASEYHAALGVFGCAMLLVFFGDRTPLFWRSSKQYDGIQMAVLTLLTIAGGLATLKRSEKGDLGFLNREQTDEWKGWMQVMILIYHYLGASKISGIYNNIRVLVAAYLFMTGYGHFFFYYKKADFSFSRVFSVLIRLNLLPVVLAYTMDTDWLSYYFSPLVTMWFCIIWVTMFVGARWNANIYFMLAKIIASAALVATFFYLEWPLAAVFKFSNQIFATDWIAKEWAFRVMLDLYVPYSGMLAALLFIKISENRLTEEPSWPQGVRYTTWASAAALVAFTVFQLQYTKFQYNHFHPYISIIPVLAFAVVRNATPYLRSVHSTFYAYFGRCSLETFIIQFHLWMAADTRGLLTYIGGTTLPWRILNFVLSTFAFVFVSEQVANATGKLTELLCGKAPRKAPRVTKATSPEPESRGNYVSLPMKDEVAPPPAEKPETKTHSRQASTTVPLSQRILSDQRVRFSAILATLWLLNIVYPTDPPPQGHMSFFSTKTTCKIYLTTTDGLPSTLEQQGVYCFYAATIKISISIVSIPTTFLEKVKRRNTPL